MAEKKQATRRYNRDILVKIREDDVARILRDGYTIYVLSENETLLGSLRLCEGANGGKQIIFSPSPFLKTLEKETKKFLTKYAGVKRDV